MIDMDYEQKYNEALKRAEAAINIAADKDLVKGVASTIFPELAESEDERIRKKLYCTVLGTPDTDQWFHDVSKEAMLAWLEKQKEQKPIPLMNGDADLYFDNWRQEKQGSPTKRQCFEEGMRYAQRLQKEHQNNSDAPNESSWSGIISSSHKDKNLDEIAQDYVDGVKEYNPEPTWDLMQTAVCYGYHYREGEEQKPVECLKAERDGWYVCIKDFYGGGKKQCSVGDLVQAKGGMYMMGKEDISEWFRKAYYEDVRDAFEPNTDTNIPEQNPAEWSDEDEKILNELITIMDGGKVTSGTYLSEYVAWLKSLRPSWKPSEEQMGALRRAVNKLAKSDVADSVRLSIMYDNLKEYSDGKN